jgi:hypothetical protein
MLYIFSTHLIGRATHGDSKGKLFLYEDKKWIIIPLVLKMRWNIKAYYDMNENFCNKLINLKSKTLKIKEKYFINPIVQIIYKQYWYKSNDKKYWKLYMKEKINKLHNKQTQYEMTLSLLLLWWNTLVIEEENLLFNNRQVKTLFTIHSKWGIFVP